MDKKIVMFVNTKVDKDGDTVRTKLTIDFSNLEISDVLEYAVDTLVVKIQGQWRRKNSIPKEFTYTPPKYGARAQAPMTDEDALAKLVPDETLRKSLLAKHGDAATVLNKLREMLGGNSTK